MASMELFKRFYALADQMIADASKKDVAETARLLALNLAHYQGKFGDLPLEGTLAMLNMDTLKRSLALVCVWHGVAVCLGG